MANSLPDRYLLGFSNSMLSNAVFVLADNRLEEQLDVPLSLPDCHMAVSQDWKMGHNLRQQLPGTHQSLSATTPDGMLLAGARPSAPAGTPSRLLPVA